MRLTLLDECGTVVESDTSTLVASAFVSVTWTPNYAEAEEITQVDADGALCVDDQGDPALRWLDLTVVVCVVDPDMINLITGDPVVVDDAATPNTVGFRINAGLTGTANFALELWSGVTGQACTTAGFPAYGYWLFPWVKDARWGETVVQNGALVLTFEARAVFNSDWGVGPYNIRRDAVTPATLEPLLSPIGEEDVLHFEVTTAPLPDAGCGAIPLAIP